LTPADGGGDDDGGGGGGGGDKPDTRGRERAESSSWERVRGGSRAKLGRSSNDACRAKADGPPPCGAPPSPPLR